MRSDIITTATVAVWIVIVVVCLRVVEHRTERRVLTEIAPEYIFVVMTDTVTIPPDSLLCAQFACVQAFDEWSFEHEFPTIGDTGR